MAETITFKCPCCGAKLGFSGATGEMTCQYCDSSFTMEQARAAQEAEAESPAASDMTWTTSEQQLITDENGKVSGYLCSSCGAEMVADEKTAATECPYCGNNAVIPQSFEGMYRPDKVIPFAIDKEKAKEAVKEFYKGKKLLPDAFTGRVDNISGVYVPFWLMSCHAAGQASYEGIKKSEREDAEYRYVKKDFYYVERNGEMDFENIPADASTKMDDSTMDSIEPFDLNKAVEYNAAYFSGYLADRYDVDAKDVLPRANERVENTVRNKLREATKDGRYDSVEEKSHSIQLSNSRQEYAMLPVWLLSTTYEGQVYSFAMNGQSGKVAGSLPVDQGKYKKQLLLGSVIAAMIAAAIVFLAGGQVFHPVGTLIAVAVGILIGFIRANSMKSAMSNIARGTSAVSYLKESSVRMGKKTDRFSYSKTEKTAKPK